METTGYGQNVVRLLTLATLFSLTAAHGATVRYESELHTGNNIMAFHNLLSSERDIIQVVVQLGAGAFFDPTDAVMALGSTSLTRTITVTHFDPDWTAISTNSDVGLSGTLLSAFSADRKTATFNFTDFDPGEKWGVFVDFDPASGTGDPAGSGMNGVMVSVLFAGGITLTSSCNDSYFTVGVDECHPAKFNGQKKSFPSANSASFAGTPEPVTGLLLGSGLIAFAVLRKTRLRSRDLV